MQCPRCQHDNPSQAKFEAEQQAIIEQARVVHALGVDDEGTHEGTQVEELIPVAIVPGQPRDLQAEHGPTRPRLTSATSR